MTELSSFDLVKNLKELIDSSSSEDKYAEWNNELLNIIKTQQAEVEKFYDTIRWLEGNLSRINNKSRRKDSYHLVFKGLGRDGITHRAIYRGKKYGASLRNLSSFRALMALQARKRQLGKFAPETGITHKTQGEKFARAAGLKTAMLYDSTFRAIDLPFLEGTVIKPANELGSKGVFLIKSTNEILDVQTSTTLSSLDELREKILELSGVTKREGSGGVSSVRRDEWILEKAIFDQFETSLPARDIKFYSFYGKVGLVLEILRFPEKRYCWWDAYGNRVLTGKYEDVAFCGRGVSVDEIRMAEDLSREIPGAFIRIDFLRGQEGLVLGEFSGGVGDFHLFNEEWDQRLGDLFLEAEGRLLSDALQGKAFILYDSFLRAHYSDSSNEIQILFSVRMGKSEKGLIQAIQRLKKKSVKGYTELTANGVERFVLVRAIPDKIDAFRSELSQLVADKRIRSFTERPNFDPIDYQLSFQIR